MNKRCFAFAPRARRYALCIVGATLFALSSVVEAQQPKKVFRIAYLSAWDAATDSPRSEGIRLALRELGYIEGQNITIEHRYAEGKRDRYPELAAELVRLKVDIIVVSGGVIPIQAAKKATKTIPIVISGVGFDPVEAGLVESLARPGGNVTGITNLETGLGGKRLELLKEVVPKLTRIAVLYDPAVPAARVVREDLPVAARALRLSIKPWEIRAADDFEKVFAALNKERPEALYMSSGLVITANGKGIADFALKSRLPSVYSTREAVEAGGLIYYGADVAHSYRRVAYYVDKILKGTKPTDLPVEQPMKFEFKQIEEAAGAIGLQIRPLEVKSPDEFESAVETALKDGAGAFIVASFGLLNSHRARIVDLVAKTRLPAIYTSAEFVRIGGLMSYADDPLERPRRAAGYVDKILKGANPADLPVEPPRKFELIINSKTAEQMQLTIPPKVLAKADTVIK